MIQDKKQLTSILRDKNILEPSIMKGYFDALFLIKKKEMLYEHIEHFINTSAYIGFSDFDANKLLLAFKVLYPDPKKIDKNLMLNLMVRTRSD